MWTAADRGRRRRLLRAGAAGLASLVCAAACVIPPLAVSVGGGVTWPAAGRLLTGVVALVGASVAIWSWTARRRRRRAGGADPC
jgi:hypothetical protein